MIHYLALEEAKFGLISHGDIFYRQQTLSRRSRRYLSFDTLGVSYFGNAEIVSGLEIQPGTSIAAKVARQSHSRISGNGTTFTNDVVNATGRDIECFCERAPTHAKGNQKVLAKYFAGMYWSHAILKHLTHPQ
jgi:hypothetical protein